MIQIIDQLQKFRALQYHPKTSHNAGVPKGVATVVYCTFPSENIKYRELGWWRRDDDTQKEKDKARTRRRRGGGGSSKEAGLCVCESLETRHSL